MRRPVLPIAVLIACAAFAADPWSGADLLAPAQLAARLRSPQAVKPVIFYVGFGVLYRSKHIPGAEFAGPAGKQEGLELLRTAALKQPRDRQIVIYCGCCPWDHCPNLRPAFLMLRELGFTQVKVLSLPTNFPKDWIEKGYPVDK
jgi:hypothetical protein